MTSRHTLRLQKANEGDPEAQYKIGRHFFKGRGTAQDLKKAFEWFKKSAEQKHLLGTFMLGVCYHKGKAVPIDFTKAVEYYTIAADAGNKDAQYNLACCHLKGKGTPIDRSKATLYFEKAAAQGDKDAQRNLNILSMKLQFVKENEAENQNHSRTGLNESVDTSCSINE